MNRPAMIIDASDGNWQQLVSQLTAISHDYGLEADLICPNDLRRPATRLIAMLNLQERINFVAEHEMFEKIIDRQPERTIPIAVR